MRIVTWNLKHGAASDAWPQLQRGLDADIALLQESRQPCWSGAVAWENVPHANWGSAVLVGTGAIRRHGIEGYEGWVVGGEVIGSGLNASDRSLYVFSVHVPTGNASRPRRQYVEEAVGILKAIRSVVPDDADLVLGGDFNFLSLGERLEGEGMKTTLAEREALASFDDAGLISCWSASHPERALAQTLRWSADKAPGKCTPYHCDGIFVPRAWKGNLFCEVLTSACFHISDHNPVAAWISL